jgi:alpha-tubulin suppressor-like RCC1 family protein
MGIDVEGKLYGWGQGLYFALADGTTFDRSSPTQIAVGGSWSTVSTGATHYLAIKTDGTLWTWGENTAINLLVQPQSWSALSIGTSHTLAIRSDGALFAWGSNSAGQLGLGDIVTRSSPVQISNASWSSVVAGDNQFSVAIDSLGNLYTWGLNTNGQLGINLTTNRSRPVLTTSGSWTTITAGDNHALAIDTLGQLFVWGINSLGQLGQNDSITRSSPVQIAGSWSKVGAGLSNSTAIDNLGQLYAWGVNNVYQVGDATSINRSSPTQIGLGLSWLTVSSGYTQHNAAITTNSKLYVWGDSNSIILPVEVLSWTAVTSGISNYAAIRSDGLLFTWGLNNAGQLGDGTVINKSSPVLVGINVGAISWTAVSAGTSHMLAVDVVGRMYAWGLNSTAQLGLDDTVNRSRPTQIATGTSFTAIAGGVDHSIAVDNAGTLYTWGNNTSGQLGQDDTITRSSPTTLGALVYTKVTAGASYTAAIDNTGKLYLWGLNTLNQLGDGTTIARSSPVQIGASWSEVSAGFNHTVAIDNNDKLFVWGNASAILLSPIVYSWSQLSSGALYTVGIRDDGLLFAWGDNSTGQLGTNNTIKRSSPVQIGNNSWTNVAAGIGYTTLAIRLDSTLWVWGAGDSGQLGDNSSISKSSPVQVSGSWASVSSGLNTTYAIDIFGLLYASGFNNVGQLGDNTSISKSSPVQIGTSSWSLVSAGQSFTTAITSDGKLFTWGLNTVNQLGSNIGPSRSSPVQIANGISFATVSAGSDHTLGLDNLGKLYAWGNPNAVLYTPGAGGFIQSWSQIKTGASFTIAIRNDNLLFAWGTNAQGQLGQGDTVTRSSPVLIGTNSWVSVGVAASTAFAVRADNTLWAWGFNSANAILGDNSTISKSSPVQIGDNAAKVLGGTDHAFYTSTTGTLYGWGSNSAGQLGLTDTIIRSSPIQIGSSSWSQVAAGNSFTVGIVNNRLFTWGFNGLNSLLGDANYNASKSSPTQIAIGTSFTAVDAGFDHALAIDSASKLYTWGNALAINVYPALIGTGESFVQSWSQIVEGSNHTLGIRNDGLLFSWGRNASGALGINAFGERSSPVQLGVDTYIYVGAGASHSLAVKSDNTLWVWGDNSSGQLGIGDTINRSSPILLASNFSKVWGGPDFTLATNSSGLMFGWGRNTAGQIGDNTTINKSSPVQIGTSSWSLVAAGVSFALGISENRLFTWGLNNNRQLGNNFYASSINRSSPIQIANTVSFITASAGTDHSLAIDNLGRMYTWGNAGNIRISPPTFVLSWTQLTTSTASYGIRSDGLLFAWGTNTNGILGNGDTLNRSSPVLIGTDSWIQVEAGSAVVYAIKLGGTLWGWGDNTGGRLGDNTVVTKSSPVLIDGGVWSKISATSQAAAIKSDGSLWTWGPNGVGQLGQNDTITRSAPTQIGSSSWTTVSVSYSSMSAIDAAGKLYVWGLNNTSANTLGLNDNFNRSSPSQIAVGRSFTQVALNAFRAARGDGALSLAIASNGTLWTWGDTVNYSLYPAAIGQSFVQSWTQIATGLDHTLAIRSDGLMFAWGIGTSGQLGRLNAANTQSPVLIGTSSWSQVAAGTSYSLAIRSDGGLYGWGANAAFQLGLNDTLNRSSPVQIGVATNWSKINAGPSTAAAITTTGSLFTFGAQFATGLLGQNDTVVRSAPTQVGTSSWSQVDVGLSNMFAITSNGRLFAWGGSTVQQLGLADFINRSSPTQIAVGTSFNLVSAGSLFALATSNTNKLFVWGQGSAIGLAPNSIGQSFVRSWNQISTGTSHTLAIRSDGLLFGWGNGGGLIGDGTTNSRSSPVQIGLSSWTSISAGSSWTLGISGTNLFAWGVNTNGELGLNDTVTRSSPTQIAGSWSRITTDIVHSLATRTNGTLWAWGTNAAGQLGTNDTITRSSPSQIGALTTWTGDISTGQSFSGAINNVGQLYMWGANSLNQVGDFTVIPKSSPVQVGAPTSFTIISTGIDHSAAIDSTSKLYVWGNPSGALVYPDTFIQSWSSIASNGSHMVAINSSNKLFTWGLNSSGQLGISDTVNRSSPVQIGNNSWKAVAAGTSHTLAIDSNNNLYGWGNNANGQLGLSDTVSRSSPNQIGLGTWGGTILASTSWHNVMSASADHSAVINNANQLFTWGGNSQGQLGDNSTISKSSPVQTSLGGSWRTVSAGPSYTVAIASNNRLYGWGFNQNNIIGDASRETRSNPVVIGTSSWTKVSAGASHVAAVKLDSTLWTWGDPLSVSLFTNTYIVYSWTSVAGGFGGTHFAAVRSDGRLYTWGNNASGQLGVLDTITRSSPVLVGTRSWTTVGVGDSHTLAVRSDGLTFAWGTNSAGQLGNLTTVNRSSPIQVGAATNWSEVKAGTSFSMARNSLGQLFTWGLNNVGQLGNNTTINRSSPVQSGTGNSFVSVTAGISSPAGIDNLGRLWAWGGNNIYQVGDATNLNRSSPVQVAIGTSWSKVSSGANHKAAIATNNQLYVWGDGPSVLQLSQIYSWNQLSSGEGGFIVGIRNDGLLFAWGNNAQGQLGINSTVNRSSPVQIGNSSYTFVEAGLSNAYAISAGRLFAWGSTPLLGDNSSINKSNPVQIGVGVSFVQVEAAASHVLARATTGALYGIGYGAWAGFNDTITRSSITQVGALTNWASIATKAQSSLAVKTDGTLWTWGGHVYANGIPAAYSSPVQILSTTSFTQVAIGSSNNFYAISTTNKLHTWGQNQNSGVPLVNEISSWKFVGSGAAAATNNYMAIGSDGLLYSWGATLQPYGAGFAFGTPTLSSPVQIGVSTWNVVGTNNANSLAIRSNSTLWTWGTNNAQGQLGINSTVNRSSPVQIGIATNWTKLNRGANHAFAINSLGQGFAWGLNTSAQLGINDILNRSNPVQVAVGTSWNQLFTGSTASIGLDSLGRLYTWGAAGGIQISDNYQVVNKTVPVQSFVGLSFTQIAAEQAMAAAIRTDGSLFIWSAGQTPNDLLYQNEVRSWTQLATGSSLTSHNAAIRSDGAMFCWGSNTVGQVGNFNIGANYSSPVQIGFSSWTAVSVGSVHTLAIRADGTLWSWGNNAGGQLGINLGAVNRSSPAQVGALTTWTRIVAGNSHSMAIDNLGKLYTWGLATVGQLGLNSTVQRSSPVIVPGVTSWSQISANYSRSGAIDSIGRCWIWGQTSAVGDGAGNATIASRSSPVIVSGTNSFTQIAAGSSHWVALATTGAAYTWGLNSSGQLGLNIAAASNRSTPTIIPGADSWSAVGAGNVTTYLVRATGGALYATGFAGSAGLLGANTTVSRSSPVLVSGGFTYATTARPTNRGTTAGAEAAYALGSNSLIYSWGFNTIVSGRDDATTRTTPISFGSTPALYSNFSKIVPNFSLRLQNTSYTQVAVGLSFGAAIDNLGRLYAWGLNSSGQLGTNDTVNRSSITQINVGTSFIAVGARATGIIALDTLSRAVVMGTFASGDATNVSTTRSSPTILGSFGNRATNYLPVPFSHTASWTSVSAGAVSNAAAIRSDGALFTWGEGTAGQLGNTTIVNRSIPTQVGTSSWSQVSIGQSAATGARFMAGVGPLGLGYVWGSNTFGQIADNTTANKSSPVAVGISPTIMSAVQAPLQIGTSSWTHVSAGNSATFAIRSNSTLWAWGQNSAGIFLGQLGTGDTVTRSSMVQIGALSTWSTTIPIATAQATQAGVLNNTLYMWGLGTNGVTGLGNTVARSSPVQLGSTQVSTTTLIGETTSPIQVTTATNWADVFAANSYTLAVDTSQNMYVWGLNTSGQLGIGTTTNRSSPVQVSIETVTKIPNNGSDFTPVIYTNNTLYVWGLGTTGQLDNQQTINRSNPIQVGSLITGLYSSLNNPTKIGDSSWTNVTAGASFTVGILSNNTLYAWGLNNVGQLGDSSTITKSSPVQIGTSSWTTIPTNNLGSYAAAIRSDGTAWVWGLNTSTQLGLLDATNRNSPTQLGSTQTGVYTTITTPFNFDATTSFVSINAANSFSTAIDNLGRMFAWGTNSATFQLGTGDSLNRSSPVQISTGTSFTAIGSGVGVNSFTAALGTNNTAYVWGLGTSGQLGMNDALSRSQPIQQGVTQTGNYTFIPVPIQVGTSTYSAIGIGPDQNFAITSDSRLFVWGLNNQGQLAQNDAVTRSSPTQILGSWSTIGSAFFTTTSLFGATKTDGTAFWWGSGANGALGTNDTITRSSPVQLGSINNPTQWNLVPIPTQIGTSSWSQVEAGTSFSLAIRSDYTLFGWGTNGNGQLGIVTLGNFTSPVVINSGNSYIAIGTLSGGEFSSAIRTDGTAWLMGQNAFSELGLNNTASRSSPTQLGSTQTGVRTAFPSPVQIGTSNWSQVAAGTSYSLALTSDNSVFVWGQNANSQLGTNDVVTRSSPTQISTSSFTLIEANHFATTGTGFALRTDNTLFAWGVNAVGQLGMQDVVTRSSPTQQGSTQTGLWTSVPIPTLIGDSSWSQVSAGSSYNLIQRIDGTIWTWGSNAFGRLGLQDTILRSIPTQIGTGSWSTISAGTFHAVAIDNTGLGFLWGYNATGELGDSSTINKSSPVQLGLGGIISIADVPIQIGDDNWLQIAAGTSYTLAQKSNNTLWAWGVNSSGQLGLNNTITYSSPIQVGISTYTSTGLINRTWSSSAAIRSDNTLFTWGLGPTGDGLTINRSNPNQIGLSNPWLNNGTIIPTGVGLASTVSYTQIATYTSNTYAIQSNGTLWGWGINNINQLLQNDTVTRSSPTQILAGTSFSVIGKISNSIGAITNTNSLFVWGNNTTAQIGDNTTLTRSSPVFVGNNQFLNTGTNYPVQIFGIGDNSWTAVSAGTSYSYALRNDGAVFVWGLNSSGQLLRNNTTNLSILTQLNTSSYSIVNAGTNFVNVIGDNNLLFTGGRGAEGQVANNTALPRSNPTVVGSIFNTNTFSPVLIDASGSWSATSAGTSHSLGISANVAYAWGLNNVGQLGNNNTINRSSPITVASSLSFTSVSAGRSYSAAIDTTGLLFAWGLNSIGQLGDGSTVTKSSPTQIGSSSWTQVNVNGDATGAIRAGDNALFMWGGNAGGQLGTQSTVNFNSPIHVGSYQFVSSGARSPVQVRFGIDNSWTAAYAGANFTFAIYGTNTLYAWGLNDRGQFGDGTTIIRSNPTQLAFTYPIVRTGGDFTAFIDSNNLLFTTGSNPSTLGLSDTINRSSPTNVGATNRVINTGTNSPLQVGADNSWVSVSAGTSYSLAKRNDGLLFGWGLNNAGQLGLNVVTSRSSPTQLSATSWASISAGSSHSVGTYGDDTLYAWGLATTGQLGLSDILTSRSSPVLVGSRLNFDTASPILALSGSYTQVSAGLSFSGAIRSDYTLWMWGLNIFASPFGGQLGTNDVFNRSSPAQVGGSWSMVKAAALGFAAAHTGAIRTDGTLWMWGQGGSGQLGINNTNASGNSSPIQVTTGGSWNMLSAMQYQTMAIRDDGGLYVWGDNTGGVFGTNSTISRSTPTLLQTQLTSSTSPINLFGSWSQASAGLSSTMGITAPSSLGFAWGLNTSGQLASTDAVNRSSPQQVGSGSWTALYAGSATGYGLTPTNNLFGWGLGSTGQISGFNQTINRSIVTQIGNNFISINMSRPHQIGTASWQQISVGSSYNMGIKAGGTLFVWGANAATGLMGDGTSVAKSSPVQIGTSSWSAISAGFDHALAISDYSLFVWGNNAGFQLGLLNTINRSSPTLIPISDSWLSIAAGTSHSLALNSSSQLYAWGIGTTGQMGDNTAVTKSSPVLIGTSTWSAVYAGQSTLAALDSTFNLYVWGLGTTGQLGDPFRIINRSNPTQVGNAYAVANAVASPVQVFGSWKAVAAANSYTVAIANDDTLYAWGLNTSRQLGDSTTINRSSPVHVGTYGTGGYLSWTTVSAGGTHTAAVNK